MFALEIEFPPLQLHTGTMRYHFSQQIHFFCSKAEDVAQYESRFLLIKFI
jgi:hypothetical protein